MTAFVTIAIPTYNRPEALTRTVNALVAQWRPEFRLLIVDNQSERPVESYIPPADFLCIVRNRVNIGGNPNIMRCFEICDTEWLWVIGDDDIPDSNALENILAEIAQNPEACGINFLGTSKFSPKTRTRKTAQNVIQFLDFSENFSHMLWLPTNVYRLARLRQNIAIACLHTYSFSAQFLMQLLTARSGLPVVFSPRLVMTHCEPEQGQQWHYGGAATGMVTLLEVPLGSAERKRLANLLIPVTPFTQEALSLLYAPATELADTRFLFLAKWSRLIYASRNLKAALAISIIYGASLVRPLSRPLISLIYRALRGKPFKPNSTDRYHRI